MGDIGLFYQYVRLAFPFHTSPRRIALGVSIGLFVAFLPAIGFQMGMALVIAWVLNASRPAAIASVWITNPLTMGWAYTLAYLVGRPFWHASHEIGLLELSQAIQGDHGGFGMVAVFAAFRSMFSLGTGVFMPMLIGGTVVGALAGFLGYYPVHSVVTHVQRSRRRRSRQSRRGISPSLKQGPGHLTRQNNQGHGESTRQRAA